jgi:hypothetical protein
VQDEAVSLLKRSVKKEEGVGMREGEGIVQ